MNANAVNVAVVDGKTITQTVELSTAKNGQPVRIKAVKGGHYILGEGEKGIAPENITIKRVGKDLHVALEGSDPNQPQLIIEDFEGSGGQLVGIAEDGSYYEYISSDAEEDRSAALLMDGVSSPQVLGAQPLTGFGDGLTAGSGIGWFWPALLGLGALGLLGGIYAATRDDGKKDNNGGNGDKGSIGGADDNVGDKQGLIENGGSTDDKTPTFSGIGRPGTSVEIIDNGNPIGTAIVGEDGKWEFTPAEPGLPDGSHTIVVVPVDQGGNKGEPSPGYVVIIDTVAPSRPLIDSVFDDFAPNEGPIASGGHTNDTTPTLSGTGEAGSIIRIYDDGVEIGSTVAEADGTWSFTPDPALAEGPHEFTVTAEDAAGNISVPSLPFPIIVDITAPTRPGDGNGGIEDVQDNVGPVQGSIENGGTTDDKTPTFSGGGLEPGDTVIIIDNGTEIGTAIVGEDGKWEFTPEEPGMEDGRHDIVVVIKDPAGNESEPSDPPYVIIIDPSSPGKPGAGAGGIDDVLDNVGPIQGSIEDGGLTDDDTPTLVGTGGQPGNTVIIIIDDAPVGSAIVDQDGKWEFTPNPALEEGTHELVVVVKDPQGNESEPSDPHTIIIDLTAPGKPGAGAGGIDDVLDNVGPIQGSIGNGGTTDDTTPTLVGSGATPGDTVTIIDDGLEIGTAIVGDDGKWEFTPDPALIHGPHPITVIITDPAGNASEPSDPYIIIVDTFAPAPPTIDSVFDDQGTSTGNINPGDTTDDAQPEISGTAEPGSTVIIYDNDKEIGRTTANPDGSWSYIPVPPLLNGPHDLSAKAEDAAGNISDPSNSVDFNLVAGGLPPAPSITGVDDDVADNIGNIMPGGITNDTEPQVSGTAEHPSIVSLYANDVLVGTTTTDASGIWSITPNPPLGIGLNNLTATATNTAGNTSAPTGEYPITVDITPPAAADASQLEDNVGAITGPINSGDITDDNTPTFSGTAEANTTLIILDNGAEIARVPVDSLGNWSYTPAPPLANGNYSFSSIVVDAAGNRSPESTAIDFTVDTSAVAISIEQVLDNVGPIQNPLASGGVTDDTTPTLRGQATPGATVNIYLDGVLHQAGVPVNALGEWEYTFAPALAHGNYVFNASVVTPAGGESPLTADFDLEIDLTVPTPPSIDEVRDDVGDIQDPLVDGATTDDTTPTLVGSGVAGDTIIIRNNGAELDRVTVQPDGSWSYTPNPPLNHGSTNEFDVIAQDPAGNQSDPSNSWTIIIDTEAPTTSAVVESMGKDSGADSGDFVTNDGSAGRLIQGSLTAALVAGEKVQVSTDGGATWLDVLMNADGTWSFIDQNSHSSDWTIQTRVVDAAGNANTTSQAVILDTVVHAPTAVTWDGSVIQVDFDGTGLALGDKLHFVIDGAIIEHVLTSAEIDAGTAGLPWTASSILNPDSIRVALVDQTGNVSAYREFLKTNTVIFSEDFDGVAHRTFVNGEVIDFGQFDLRVLSLSPTAASGITSHQLGWADPSPTNAIQMATGSSISLDLDPSEKFTSISMQVGDFNNFERLSAIFYDQNGVEVHRVDINPSTSGIRTEITHELPYGLSFSSVTLNAYVESGFEGLFWIDNIQLSRNEYAPGTLVDAEANQTIAQGNIQYYGGDVDNIFSLADVSLLDGADAGINGGAGVDTLTLTGTGQILDLSAIAGKLESIEIVDLTGTGNNTLNLSLGDVLEQGESSLFTADETVQMMIKGNAGDVVNLDDLLPDGTDPGDWATAGTATVAGVVYNVYQHSTLDAQLLVQDGVTTNLV